MLEFLKSLGRFFKSMLSNTGDVSSNRFYLGVVIGTLMGLAMGVTIKTGVIPEIPTGWITVIGFLGGFSLGGKLNDTYKAVKTPPVNGSADAPEDPAVPPAG